MAEQSLLAKLGLRTGTVGSSGSLAIAFGNGGGTTGQDVHTAANRTGLYASLAGGSETIAMVVGGQVGPTYIRSGTDVDVSITGSITTTQEAVIGTTLNAGGIITAKVGSTVGMALVPQGGVGNFTGSLTSVVLTADRTYTFPDADVTISGSAGVLRLNQNVPFTTGAGLLQTAAGFIVVGTPSATAPSTGTNGPGTVPGIILQGADGVGQTFVATTFGNGVAKNTSFNGFACQGIATAPGATITGDNLILGLRGHDGTDYTVTQARVELIADGTWTPSSRPTYIQFRTTPSASTSIVIAGRIDSNQVLVWGGSVNSVSTYSAGTQRPHVQILGTAAATAGVAQGFWANSAGGPTYYLTKSRSATVGTQGVITTGDTLGTLSWQGDDGTNFIAAAQIVAVATGTIGTGQIPGLLRVQTATSAGTMTTASQWDSGQNLVIGNTTTAGAATYTGGTVTPRLQIKGNNAAGVSSAGASIAYFSNSTSGPSFYLAHARSNTIDTMTVVTTGDTLGTISFQGSDGTNFLSAAAITVTCTGTIAGSRVPGNIIFQTGVDAAGSALTTALTIDNAQKVTVNAATVSSSTTTGALVVSGGVGIAGATFIGGSVTINGANISAGSTTLSIGAFTSSNTNTATSGGLTSNSNLFETVNPASSSTAILAAARISITTQAANAQNLTDATSGMRGFQATATHAGTGTVTAMSAGMTQIVTSNSSGTVTNAFGIRMQDGSKSAGTTITTLYGLYVDTQSAGTNNYAIYTNLGAVVFGDRQYLNAANTAPTDGNIPTSAVSWYLDEVGNTLKVRVRYADGTTLKTGTVALV